MILAQILNLNISNNPPQQDGLFDSLRLKIGEELMKGVVTLGQVYLSDMTVETQKCRHK